MKLTKYAKLIKNQLALTLEKQGSSIERFEKILAGINTGEGVLKFAAEVEPSISSNLVRSGLDFGASVPEIAFKGMLAGGAISGLTLDEMDQSVDGVNKALARERQKVILVKRLTENLRREHGLA
jgi:uncharacterized protein YoaH (UPF0181 family)